MKTDNILVSREKWEAMESFITDLHNAHIEWDLFDPLTMGRDISERLKEIFAMPDFIESERDVDDALEHFELWNPNVTDSVKVHSYLVNQRIPFIAGYNAAINALRIKGE